MYLLEDYLKMNIGVTRQAACNTCKEIARQHYKKDTKNFRGRRLSSG